MVGHNTKISGANSNTSKISQISIAISKANATKHIYLKSKI